MRSATPVLDLPASINLVGQSTPISFHVHDPRGLRSAAAFLEQNGSRFPVWETRQATKAVELHLHLLRRRAIHAATQER